MGTIFYRLSRASEAITAEDIQRATKVKTESELSMTNLIENQDFTSIIHDPREYQLELFEKAKAANIIAVLDTGMRFHAFNSYSDINMCRIRQNIYRCAFT